MEAQKNGIYYETGIAMKQATKKAKVDVANKVRNPQGTPKDRLKCKFRHEMFCAKLGHSSCRSKECFRNGKSKTERETAERFILDTLVKKELESMKDNRK